MTLKQHCMSLVLSIGLLTHPLIQAQDNTDSSANNADEETQIKTEEKAAKKSSQLERNSPKIFKPSEAISEDLSVSFPVDI